MVATHIGPYKVVRLIGKGGMGQVYEALHEELERRVAIKILHPEYAQTPEFLNRFFNEARAANVISHPGLVQISEFGQLPDGCAYLVMEYLDGETLSSRLRRLGGRIPEPVAVSLGWQLASILAATHAKNIVHRDLKPGNIMMAPDPAMPGGERVKLFDFGIAKIRGEPSGTASQPQTRTGMLLGTPLYMSPEQCRGAGQVGEKSDVYSLGVILYQLLAGQPPFLAEGDGSLIAMHLFKQPRPLLELAPDVSPPLAALVDSALLKDPTERPTMSEVYEHLSPLYSARASMDPLPAAPEAKPPHPSSASQPAPFTNPTAMRHSTGQQTEPRSKLPRLGGGVLAVAMVVASAFITVRILSGPGDRRLRAGPAAPSIEVRPKVAVEKIHWTVTSIPPGAEVLRADDNQILGKTPWQVEQQLAAGPTELILRAAGYRDRRIVADRGQSHLWQESLEPLIVPSGGDSEPKKAAPKASAGPPKPNPCPEDKLCSVRAKRAMELYDGKQYEQALREFQAAYTLAQDAPRLLIHIGLCMLRLGRAKQARQYYQSYLDAAPQGNAATRNLVKSYLAEANAALAGAK